MRLHERTTSALDIENESFCAFCKFLRKNRSHNQRNGGDSPRNIAQSVEFLVRRSDFRCLSRHRASAGRDNILEILKRKRCVVPGNGLKLVRSSAGQPKTTTSERRYRHSATCGKRLDYHGEFIPNASSGMLVCRRHGKVRPVHYVAGIAHGFSQRKGFIVRHSFAANGHGECRHLIVGHLTFGISGNERTDLS